MSRRRHGSTMGIAGPSRSRQQTLETMFRQGFQYSKKLTAHTSCVNSMTFSAQGARYLATGGDDLDVHIWDFHQENLTRPLYTCTGPRRNIFTLAFSATNKYLLAGGTDNTIHKFDITCLNSPPDMAAGGRPADSLRNADIVRSVSCHPTQDEVFLSATDDGRIVVHDQRSWKTLPRAQDTIALDCEVTDVKWHPTLEHLFATSESNGTVCLRDTRMAFGPSSRRTREGVVQTYSTRISKGSLSYLSNPEPSSLTFDRDGKKLVVTMLNHNPTVYSLKDPNPLAVCRAANLPNGIPVPEGQRTYSNSCTMKHGSIGALGLDSDDFYCAGSDDFCAYIWKIPPLSELSEQRKVIPSDEWCVHPEYANEIGYTEGLLTDRYLPVSLDTPLDRLTGHKSIINTTLVHPSFPFILACGIEQHIFLHASSPHLPFSEPLEQTPKEVRRIGTMRYDPYSFSSTPRDSDDEAIALFDHIITQEGEADPFLVRKYIPDTEEIGPEEDSDDDLDEDEDEDEDNDDEGGAGVC
ncbi:WD40-repeat-containing domain protein [Mucidula mucida]|nr:WD40-repeat-containing domain protein [Mucidula mucida]